MIDFDAGTHIVKGKDGIGPEIEIVCPRCETLCLIIRLTKSILDFKLECHKCGYTGDGENLRLERCG